MNPEQWLSLKWNGGSTMSDRWLNQSKIIQIMNDPSWIVAQHMKGFENLHLDDADKKKDIVNVSGTIIFEIVNK